jgi:transcriptional regulator with XRE-family HTH domain
MLYPSISGKKFTIADLLGRLRNTIPGNSRELYKALQTSSSTYLKVERGERELSFLMALRICAFYKLDLHEFISMLSDEELSRQDYSVIQAMLKRERKKAEEAKAKIIDIKDKKPVPEYRY